MRINTFEERIILVHRSSERELFCDHKNMKDYAIFFLFTLPTYLSNKY